MTEEFQKKEVVENRVWYLKIYDVFNEHPIIISGILLVLFWYLYLKDDFAAEHWVRNLRVVTPWILGFGLGIWFLTWFLSKWFEHKESVKDLHTSGVVKKNVQEYINRQGTTLDFMRLEVDKFILGSALTLVYCHELETVFVYVPSYPWPHIVAEKKDRMYSYRRQHERTAVLMKYLDEFKEYLPKPEEVLNV